MINICQYNKTIARAPFFFSFLNFFNVDLLFEREREGAQMGEGQKERETESEAGSRL